MITKVCGMRDAENIRQLNSIADVDWMGFIFTKKSKRYALEIKGFEAVTHKKKVGVFVDANFEEIGNVINRYDLDIIQLHGFETPEYCDRLKEEQPQIQIMKAFRVDSDFDFLITEDYQNSADYFLFDARGAAAGGNGIQFDWEILNNYGGEIPFLLAGGIRPESVTLIQNFKHPKWIGIDINSGFETSPALKNIQSIEKFLNQINKTIQNYIR
ncbi:MAG: phosphoribosylanthranilate isomerase [Bacteroidia bacterium]|nr:phosphoribosylanthranilate isomerase [Bacteroidia bacterium]